tara:strand:- start:619 stop:1170 length:552 start_codon:yes stop_codon:yes gene_type:complete
MNTIKTINPVIRFVSENDNVLAERPGYLRVRPDGTFGAIRRKKCYPVYDVSDDGNTVSVRVEKSLALHKDDCRGSKVVDLQLPAKPTTAKSEPTAKKPRTVSQQQATVRMAEGRLAKVTRETDDPAKIETAARALATAQENLAAMIEHEMTSRAEDLAAVIDPVKPISKMTKAELIAHIAKLS